MNSLLVADIGTGLANYAALRETAILYSQAQLPERLGVAIEDRLRAGAHALAAKSTLATVKIDLRKAAGSADDDALRAGADAPVTRSATVSELGLTNRSRRSDRTRGHRG